MAKVLNPTEAGITTSIEQGRTVYVIDDDAALRKSMHFLLEGSGITTWSFASAADFLDQLPALKPAPVVLDLRMPDVSGLALLEILIERGCRWPVIMMSAYAQVPIAVEALKLGAIDFLEKPFDPTVLEQVIADAFRLIELAKDGDLAQTAARLLIDRLTKRELEVLTIVTQGVPNKVAAYRLGLSTRTIEMHRAKALAKLNINSVLEVAALMSAAAGR